MSTISNKIKVKGKKRSRIAFAQHKRPGPEIKKTNFFFNPAAEGNNLYSSMIFVPFEKNIPSNRSDMTTSYVSAWMRNPDVGTASYQRVGSSIRVKQILLRGYLEVRQNLMTQCRVRVYFLRERNREGTTNALFKNVETIISTQTVSEQIQHMKHNFYKMMNDYNVLSKDMSIQKIMEFNLTPYVAPNTGSWTGGQKTDAPWTGYSHIYPHAEPAYCLPVNKVISLNENYTVGTDHYGIMMTCDAPYAGETAATGYLPTASYPDYTDGSLKHPFSLNFFGLVYYTDA